VGVPDHHEGYITWEEFCAIRNRSVECGMERAHGTTPGAARNGPALLAGLLRCGRCGRSLQVSYTTATARATAALLCSGDRGRQDGAYLHYLRGNARGSGGCC